MEDFHVNTSPKPCVQIPSHWGLGFKHMNLGDTNIQATAEGESLGSPCQSVQWTKHHARHWGYGMNKSSQTLPLWSHNGTPLQYSCLENPMDGGAWWAAVHGVAKSRTRLGDFTFTFHFHALEKEMATHSSVLAWRIPGMVGPGGLPSMGSHRVGHDWSDLAAAAATSNWAHSTHTHLPFSSPAGHWMAILNVN